MAAKVIPNVHVLVAERAPVIVANGGAEPVRLGARTRGGGGVLHVWDWSKGNTSRVLKEVEYWGTERAAVSPDGKHLVRAGGDILELATGKRSQIDLGGADVKIDGRTFGRIGHMRFSPDGGRLAMLVTNLDKDIPGRILSDVVQVVEFPSGRKLCEFPAGEAYALRIGFSNEGRQVAAADTRRQVMLRDVGTGDVRRRYEPAMTSQVMGVAISPDGKLVAAVQRDPADLCVWEADSGKLLARLSGEELQKLGGTAPFYGVLRFSPDGKHLAASYWGRIFVVDTSTFAVAVTLKESTAVELQWSADGQTLSAILPVIVGDHTPEGRYDICPTVHEWDWHSAHPPRRLEAKAE
jgi:WD40 repeat protein